MVVSKGAPPIPSSGNLMPQCRFINLLWIFQNFIYPVCWIRVNTGSLLYCPLNRAQQDSQPYNIWPLAKLIETWNTIKVVTIIYTTLNFGQEISKCYLRSFSFIYYKKKFQLYKIDTIKNLHRNIYGRIKTEINLPCYASHSWAW